MKIIAIIPARGGSKRIPRKNIKDFNGKPMLAYPLVAAAKSGIFEEIIVSTDDADIAEIAKKYGAAVPFMRSAKTAGDYATTFDVLDEVINEYKKTGKNFDVICCIYPCAPLLRPEFLTNAYAQMKSKNAPAIMPVCQYPNPVEWANRLVDGVITPVDRAAQDKRSQDFEPKYYDAGMFYFCKTDALFNHKSLTPDGTLGYAMDEKYVQDIDTPSDWEMAEIKYKLLTINNDY